MIIKRDDGRLYNRCFLSNRSRVVSGTYDKIRSFSFAGDSVCFERGDSLCSIDREVTRFDMSTCFDLRFLNLYALYSGACEVIFNIAEWPAARKSHFLCVTKSKNN